MQDGILVVDMDQFVTFVVDREGVLANQFLLFLQQFLRLRMGMVGIVRKCCLYVNAVFLELSGLCGIPFGYVHPFLDPQSIF